MLCSVGLSCSRPAGAVQAHQPPGYGLPSQFLSLRSHSLVSAADIANAAPCQSPGQWSAFWGEQVQARARANLSLLFHRILAESVPVSSRQLTVDSVPASAVSMNISSTCFYMTSVCVLPIPLQQDTHPIHTPCHSIPFP